MNEVDLRAFEKAIPSRLFLGVLAGLLVFKVTARIWWNVGGSLGWFTTAAVALVLIYGIVVRESMKRHLRSLQEKERMFRQMMEDL